MFLNIVSMWILTVKLSLSQQNLSLGAKSILDIYMGPVRYSQIVMGCFDLFHFYLHSETTYIPQDTDKKMKAS